MPLIEIPMDARAVLLKNAKALHDARAEGNEPKSERLQSEASGMFEVLRAMYSSATVGMLVMDYDEVLDGGNEEDAFTNLLPRIGT